MDNLNRRNLLGILKYNKRKKNRMNLKFNDYKKFSVMYSSIEIEIIPIMSKYRRIFNINDGSEYEKYFHVYFDNNKEEKRRNYLNAGEAFKKIKIKINSEIKSFSKSFYKCKCIESINFTRCIRKDITNMDSMFYECSSLKEINFNKFNTSNVTNMSYMFYGCSSLSKLNLNNFNTDNVTDIIYIFYGCLSLNELKSNNFKIKKIAESYIYDMFLESLTESGNYN